MTKKYELTHETMKFYADSDDVYTLYRIRALKDFSDVKKGDLGGWVESEINLSQKGDCWIYDNATVFKNAQISNNVRISGNAKVFGNAQVYGNTIVNGIAWVYENAQVFGDAHVCGNAKVFGDAQVYGNTVVNGNAKVSGDAKVTSMDDYSTISNFGTQYRTTTFFRCEDNKIRVSCGYFYGTIQEFRNQVKNTRKGKIAKEYLLIADLMDEHFSK